MYRVGDKNQIMYCDLKMNQLCEKKEFISSDFIQKIIPKKFAPTSLFLFLKSEEQEGVA